MSSHCDPDKLNAYYDDELAGEQRRAVEAHVAACDACAAELARLRELSRLFAGHALAGDAMAAPALGRLHDAVDAAFEERASGARDVLRLTRFVTGLAAAIMVAAGSWLVIGPQVVTDRDIRGMSDPVAIPPWEDPSLVVASAFDGGNGVAEARFAEWVVADLSRGGAGE
jgi:anti-sigma factor RsiW